MPTVQTSALAKFTATVGPANLVTAVRSVLAGVALVLVVGSLVAQPHRSALVVVAAVALALDWVDGQVARRTHTESAFGARFDMEVDAFLILVLSVYVADSVGVWVLAIGLFRYLLLAAERVVPWLRRPTPPRYWGKVVAVVQGLVLTVVAADVIATPAAVLALAIALVLLVESFGRQVWWLWRTRHGSVLEARFTAPVTVLAFAIVWVGLTLPSDVKTFTAAGLARLPLELLAFLALAAVLPRRSRTVAALAFGALLGVVSVLKTLDLGFYFALNRGFDPVVDWTYAGSLEGLLHESFGTPMALVLLTMGGALIVGLLVLTPLAVRRLAHVAADHRRASLRTVAVFGVVWALAAGLGVQLQQPLAFATTNASEYAFREVARVPRELRDREVFARDTARDPLRDVPGSQLLRGLRGKDVVFAFVESYGRSAVQGTSFAPGINAVLDDGTRQLAADGYATRSAFLTSPTFGGISWLAHSTFQSGLWVDSQERYNVLLASQRLTVSQLFGRAGWRTVADIPANTHDWPQGRFYGYDHVYDSRNVGYAGPRFGYPTMPDQFSLDALHRLELAPKHRSPVMAEIDLVSSHASWSRTPRLIDQSEVGDGSVYAGMLETLPSESVIGRSQDWVRAAYGQSIQYSISSLISFVEHYGNKDLVLVLLGDHQPATIVSGDDADHDVPVTIVAKDPAVMARVDGWHWQDGMHPSPQAPVWRMDSFRDQFMRAFAE